MPSASDVMAIAIKYIGTKEKPAGSNNVIFNTDYYGQPVSGSEFPWCCTFVWDVFRMAGASNLFYDGKKTAYCPTYENWALAAGLKVSAGQFGDVATMDFGKGRASHIGFIKSRNADGSYQTIEGNTSTSSQDNGGAVMERTRTKANIRNIFRPRYTTEVKELTGEQIIKSTANVAKMAQQGKWEYGDSHTLPPCNDQPKHKISCDRLPARALWDLGLKDQQQGGFTVLTMEGYLTKHGFKKITNKNDLKRGDIILMKANGTTKPTAAWHAFVLTDYNPATTICSKYDAGSQERINAGCFFKNVPLNEWSNRSFYCGFRASGDKEPKRLPTKGTPRTIASAVNKSYVVDIKGGSMSVKANAQLYKANGSAAQQFIIEDVKDGFVRIVNKKSGLVLDVQAGKAGNNVWQYEWNGSKAQLWKMRMNADMTVTFESAINSAYVLDVHAGKAVNGQNIGTYKWNGSKAQKWTII